MGVRSARTRAKVAGAVSALGCDVISTGQGRALIERLADAVLERADHAPPNLIIADAELPGCAGLDLLSGLRDLRWKTPVILLTRSRDEVIRTRAWRLGVVGIFIRPFDLEELRAFATLVLDPQMSAAIRDTRMRGVSTHAPSSA